MSQTQIALLRGINVGDAGKLPMSDLSEILENLGATAVKTYIQSGNAVFDGTVQAGDLADAINARFGFCPQVMILTAKDLHLAIENNPFDFVEAKDMHFFFCKSQPTAGFEKLEGQGNGAEQWQIGHRVIYLHSPGGLSKSKLAEKLERNLGVPMTARNWNTVAKLASMTDDNFRL